MSEFGKPYEAGLSRKVEREKEPLFASACLFGFGESLIRPLIWLLAALLSFVAILGAGGPIWLPLSASLVFLYWAWSALRRARYDLKVYPEGLVLSTADIGGGQDQLSRRTHRMVSFADVVGIDLRSAGVKIIRRGDSPTLVLIPGLGTKKRHQFHHRFDVQQRRGQIPASITLEEPPLASLSEVFKIIFSAVVLFWILRTLVQ